MKKIIYGLLVIGSITGSAVYGSQTQPPKRPATSVPTPLKTDNSICPDELNMAQLNELKGGNLKLGSFPFKLHTSPTEFDKMLPGKAQFVSNKASKAKISEGQAVKGRVIIGTPQGHILKCTYTFRTALGSKTGQEHKIFAITSEPTEHKPLPEGLVEAMSR